LRRSLSHRAICWPIVQCTCVCKNNIERIDLIMDEGRERDNTSGVGGPPTLPGLYLSTIQPSQRGFYRIHVCKAVGETRDR
jgi:hypothetical protein